MQAPKRNGYVALISSVIISFILTGLAFTVARSGFFSRFDSVNAEYKRISKGMAESCVNQALLELAQDPNMASVDKENSAIGCKYRITNPSTYDSGNKKIANIVGAAQYNGAFSKMEINSTIYDPQYSPPSKIVVKSFSYGAGAKAADLFGPFKVNGAEVVLGDATVFPSNGIYTITETTDPDYTVSYAGDCDSSGKISLGVNDYKTCNIVNTLKPQTASLTVVISSSDGTMPGNLTFDGVSYPPRATQKITVAGVGNSASNFAISVAGITGYNVSEWTGSADGSGNKLCLGVYNAGTVSLKKGDNIVCAIAFKKQSLAPDTVLMLDRTLSMFGDNSPSYNNHPEWINGERVAAKSLLDLYATSTLATAPKVGIGRFGTSSSTGNAEMIAALTNSSSPAPYGYHNAADPAGDTGLYAAINSGLGNANTTGTNLQSAINTAQGAFSGTNKKTIILVSDGDPNQCTGGWSCDPKATASAAANTAKTAGTEIYAIHFGDTSGYDFLASLTTSSSVNRVATSTDTGLKSPTDDSSNDWLGGDSWSDPQKAYSDRNGSASDDEGDRHIYYDFNLGVPSGAAVKGIEVKADAWAAMASSSGNSSSLFSSATGNFSGWDLTGTSKPAAVSDSNDSTYVSQGINAQTFAMNGAGVPTNATISSVVLNVFARQTNGGASIQLMAEDGSGSSSHQLLGSVQNLTDSWATYSWAVPTKPDGSAWTAVEVNNWTTKFGIFKSSPGGSAQVSRVSATVNYTVTTNGDTGFVSPSANSANGGNGFETNPSDAYANDSNSAANINGDGDRHRFYNYNFNSVLPSGAIITGLVVRPDWWIDDDPWYQSNYVNLELSWNSGTNWTSSKTEGTETTGDSNSKILGGSGDNWGYSSWSAANFLNGAFMARVTSNCDGFSCNKRDYYLDWLPVKVYYSTSNTNAVTVSATAAGNFSSWDLAGTSKPAAVSDNGNATFVSKGISAQTFAISGAAIPSTATINVVNLSVVARKVGNSASIQLMAEDGSGSSSHQLLGSVQNLTDSWATYNWSMPSKPDGSAWTAVEVNAWTTKFGIFKSSPGGTAQVSRISVMVGYAYAPENTSCKLGIDLSWNGGDWWSGPDWTSEKTQLLANTETAYTFGGPIDTWGHSWAADDFSNDDFLARVHNSGCNSAAVANLDHLEVKVYYEATAVDVYGENHDGDHFYISPSAAEMADIFQVIGEAILAPTVGELSPALVVVTQVNNASGTAGKSPADFTISIDNPSAHSFADNGTGTVLSNLVAGSYTVMPGPDPDGKYGVSQSPDCSGTIAAAQTKTCVIVYTANPPAPPPIDIQQNIDINSWVEK